MAKADDALIENLNACVAFARKRVGDPHLLALVDECVVLRFECVTLSL